MFKDVFRVTEGFRVKLLFLLMTVITDFILSVRFLLQSIDSESISKSSRLRIHMQKPNRRLLNAKENKNLYHRASAHME